jgi:2-polyprenyl-6-methoxyphenol hydroxylase-like FAD-dependent oxidoreductase
VRATLQPADAGQETAHASYLVACDGAHSPVRHALGVSFSGDDYPTDFMTADVQVDWKLPRDQHAFFFAAEGMLAFSRSREDALPSLPILAQPRVIIRRWVSQPSKTSRQYSMRGRRVAC